LISATKAFGEEVKDARPLLALRRYKRDVNERTLITLVSEGTMAAGAWVSCSLTNFTQSMLFYSFYHLTSIVGKDWGKEFQVGMALAALE
jgi:hypothetical protein